MPSRILRSRPTHTKRPRVGAGRRPWKHGPLAVIGLVGGIGAGKSTVAEEFSRRGWHVLDADKVGHALLDQRPTHRQVLERFGPSVLDSEDNDRIDRKALGQVVFADTEARRALERILHPRMRSTFEKAIERVIRRHGARGVVLDAAVLFEAGWDELCDMVVFVDAPRAVRVERLQRSRGWTGETLEAREKAQLSPRTKRSRSDLVVDNAGDRETLGLEVDRLLTDIKARERLLRSARLNPATAKGTVPEAPPGSATAPKRGGRERTQPRTRKRRVS